MSELHRHTSLIADRELSCLYMGSYTPMAWGQSGSAFEQEVVLDIETTPSMDRPDARLYFRGELLDAGMKLTFVTRGKVTPTDPPPGFSVSTKPGDTSALALMAHRNSQTKRSR